MSQHLSNPVGQALTRPDVTLPATIGRLLRQAGGLLLQSARLAIEIRCRVIHRS